MIWPPLNGRFPIRWQVRDKHSVLTYDVSATFVPWRSPHGHSSFHDGLNNASSASCWIVKLDLPILCLSLFWLPPHYWMATATLLDGYHHTLWLTCRTGSIIRMTRLLLVDIGALGIRESRV